MLIQKRSVWIFLALTAIGSARIVSTYNVFSHTVDEPLHIHCGIQYLSTGVYRYALQLEQPPLARVAAAIGPYLAGVRSHDAHYIYDPWEEGRALLNEGGHYDRNLFLARLGILPFFWIASLVVYVWTKRSSGEPCASFSVLLFTLLPPVLAHAGLATTDMALTAMVGAAFLMGLKWVEQPTARNSTFFGAVTGLAVVSKFSSLLFLPSAAIAALIGWAVAEKPKLSIARLARKYAAPLCLAATSLFLVVWAVYRFSFGAIHFVPFHVPFPELFGGVRVLIEHDKKGHPAFLLGAHSDFGWWYYFLVVLSVKTPLPFLALLIYGIAVMKHAPGIRTPLAFSLGILLICLPSHINIGVRHILPVYIGFSIVAGAGAAELLRRSSSRAAAFLPAILGVWMIATSALAHPDYLPYFNALAGEDPSRVLVDSDLDWGQDLKRLAARLREAGAQQVFFTPIPPAYSAAPGMPPVQPNSLVGPSPGWNAVSLTVLRRLDGLLLGGHLKWPDQVKPPEKIGKGIWLWYFPPAR
jgi:hypothetical protein